jgi:putative hydrolase of the HAD superfamily
MPRSPRAVIFDLDDTLYPRRRFVLSGFAAVARHLDRQYWSGAPAVYRVLVEAHRRGDTGRELQVCLAHFDLPEALLPGLVAIMRTHRPALRLPGRSRAALRALRAGWRIGIVTNGLPATQANKIRALGLLPFVDDVVYATEHGTKQGKPDVTPFLTALSHLAVEPHQSVFVGDDEVCDVGGARAAGLRTVRVHPRSTRHSAASGADVTVHSVAEVPGVIDTLVDPAWSRDVA